MNDLISRQAAIDAIEPTLKSILQGNSFKAVNVMDKIRDLPSAQPEVTEEAVKEYCRKRCLCIVDSALLKKYASAQPERKKGKWIEFDYPWFQCSECGAVREQKSFLENYCPNCGCRMNGGKS